MAGSSFRNHNVSVCPLQSYIMKISNLVVIFCFNMKARQCFNKRELGGGSSLSMMDTGWRFLAMKAWLTATQATDLTEGGTISN